MASDMHKEASSSVTATDKINKRLYVGGLFPEVTDADLIRQFGKFGKISSVDIVRRKDDQLKPEKTFAFINMTTTDQKLKKCMGVYNKSKWKGHNLQIQVAKESFLSRLAQERKETRTELIYNEEASLGKNSEVVKPSQERQWTVQGAVPGTEVAGEKNWVIGKYGRVLPVVYIRRKDKKKVMKVDPSKYSHNLKKVKEERSMDPPISQLTWSIQVQESEERRKKIQGDFSSFVKRKRSASTCKTTEKKMKMATGYKTEESLFSSDDIDAKRQSTVVQSEQGKDEEGGIIETQQVQNKTNNQEVGNISAELEESDDDSDINNTKEFSLTNVVNKSYLDAQSQSDYNNDFEVVSLEEQSQGMTGVVDGNMLLQIKKQALLEKSRRGNDSEGSVDTDELITANKSRLVQGQNMKDNPDSETSSDTAELIASSRSKLQSSVTTRDVSKNGPSKDESADEETGSESSGDTDEMIEAARGKLQAAMMSSSQTTRSKAPEERSANPPTPPPAKSFIERSVEKVQCSESDSPLSYDTAMETSAHSAVTDGKVTKQPLKTGQRKNNSDGDDDIDDVDVEEDGDDVQDDNIDDNEAEEESSGSDSSEESLVHPLNKEENRLGSRQLAGISQVDDDDKDGDDVQYDDDVQDDDDDSESEEESPDSDSSGESLVQPLNLEQNGLDSAQPEGRIQVDDDDDKDGDDEDDDDENDDEDGDEGSEDESDDSDSVESVNQQEIGPDTGEHDGVHDNDDEDDDDDNGSPDSDSSDESSSEDSSDLEESSDEELQEVKIPLHTKSSKSHKGIPQTEDHKLLEKRADDTNTLRRANSSSTSIKNEPAGGGSNLSNEQRLESLRQRQLQVQSKQALIKEALSSVDSKGSGTTGKHIVFDSEDDNDDPESGVVEVEVKDDQVQSRAPVKREEKKPQMGLFDSDSEEESDGGSDLEKSDDDRFKIKPQFEGKTGEKLLELQAQIGHDGRFRMDHRFMEEESDEDDDVLRQKPTSTEETESDVDLEAEKQKSLEILRRVVGTKAAMATEKGKNIDKLKFKDPSTVRYDPTREDHKQFEVPEKERQENVEGKKPETSETASQEETVPDTDKDRYFEVASDLKEAFSSGGDGQMFSFFGPSTTETVEDMETDVASDGSTQTAPKKSLWQPKVFQYDSSDNEDDNEINQEDLDRIAVKGEEVKRRTTFFFAADDPRLKEGVAQFCRRDKIEDIRRAWEEVRPELLEECKKRHKNAVRQRRRNKQNRSGPAYKKT